jgi:hypothetical protein
MGFLGMPATLVKRWGWRALFASMLALTLVTAYSAAPARAGDDETQNADEEEGDLIDKAVRGVLNGIGLKNTSAPGINYHERSPLVVPPTRDLPPPQKASRAAPDPAWPQDKDMNPKKVAKKKESKPASEAENEDMRQLRPDELGVRKPSGQHTASDGPARDTTGEQLSPSQLGFQGFNLGKMFDRTPEEIPFVEEPTRGALTDPPEGLRSPSPKYSYGTKNKMEPDKNGPADIAAGSRNQ